MKENAFSVLLPFLPFMLFQMIQADLNIVKYISVSPIKCVQL